MNLFDPAANDPLSQISEENLDPNVNYLEELTKPGAKFDRSKYKDEKEMYEAIAKGKIVGDRYIDHFKTRHDELKDDYKKLSDAYNAGPRLQELIDQIKQTQMSKQQTSNPEITPYTANEKENVPSLDPKELEKLISNKISEYEMNKRQLENANTVKNKLLEKYGPSYQTTLKNQIDSLGLTEDFANEIAKTHPTVFFKTFGLDTPSKDNNFQAPPVSNSRNDNFSPTGNKRTYSYYQKIRKESPNEYRSARIQDQMFKDASALGDSFFDT